MSEKTILAELEVRMFGNGRVTIDKPIRDKLKLRSGARFMIAITKILDYDSGPSKPRKEKKITKKTKRENPESLEITIDSDTKTDPEIIKQ